MPENTDQPTAAAADDDDDVDDGIHAAGGDGGTQLSNYTSSSALSVHEPALHIYLDKFLDFSNN